MLNFMLSVTCHHRPVDLESHILQRRKYINIKFPVWPEIKQKYSFNVPPIKKLL